MTTESILLVGRDTDGRAALLETHASRLRARTDVDAVAVATYDADPGRELRPGFEDLRGDRVYAVPMTAAHTHETTHGIPAALSAVPGTVTYCEPVGASPAITDVLAERGATQVPPAADASLVLVGFGSSSQPYQRRTADYHATRLREGTAYDTVLTCYLLQNPAVECVRYNVPTERAVAVPLFLGHSEATQRRIPNALELDRGGISYAEPLLDHAGVTDAIAAEVERQRALGTDAHSTTFEASLTADSQPVATDGDGRP